MFNIIIWLIAGILTLFIQDKQTIKINFFITWAVLMVNLICDYMQ